MTEPATPKPTTMLPLMCEKHRRDLLVNRLKLGPTSSWLAHELTAQILLFQWLAGDKRIWARANGNAENLSLVLAEIGCMACWDRAAYGRVYRLLQKVGLTIAAKIAQGKLVHDDWPIMDRARDGADAIEPGEDDDAIESE
jgi:hypothetical protein